MIKILVKIQNKKFVAIYDSGSNISLINQNAFQMDQLRNQIFQDNKLLRTISGKAFSKGRAILKIKIGKIFKKIPFYIIKNNNFKFQLLIGLDAIQKFKS